MIFGGGVAVAHRLATKIAAVSGEAAQPVTAIPAESVPVTPRNGYIRCGPSAGRRIALTFDDGPNPGVTERLLDELGQRNIRATFFMIGERVGDYPELARRVAAEGHEIGNHSFTHTKFSTLTAERVAEEVTRTQKSIQEATGRVVAWFRPPFGELRSAHASLVRAAGLDIVLWNVDPGDWAQPGAEKVTEAILQQSLPGSIIVCHELAQTAGCIGAIIDELHHRGLHFVTVSDLLGVAAI
jgi:peptidoglycan/xylan/chitin deacetylase (PgdA/CDA1 family)